MKAIYLIFLLVVLAPRTLLARTGYAISCKDQTNKYHHRPLSFYEMEELVGAVLLKRNYISDLQKISPHFKEFISGLNKLNIKVGYLNTPWPSDYDSILEPPLGCEVIRMLERDYNNPQKMIADEHLKNLTASHREYFIFESYIEYYLKKNLGPFDYRRFSFFIATGIFDKFSPAEKKAFLNYYEIN